MEQKYSEDLIRLHASTCVVINGALPYEHRRGVLMEVCYIGMDVCLAVVEIGSGDEETVNIYRTFRELSWLVVEARDTLFIDELIPALHSVKGDLDKHIENFI